MTATLDELVQAFHAERRNLGHVSLSAYPRALSLLLAKLRERLGREPCSAEITREDLDAVLDVYLQRRVSSTTLLCAVSALRVFCRWLVRRGALLLDPAQDLEAPRRHRRLGYVPTRGEVERLLAAARQARHVNAARGRRDLAMLEVLYGSGLRFRELVDLRVPDLDLNERTLFVRGKGGKDRVVPITKAAVNTLVDYLEKARPDLLMGDGSRLGDREPSALFLSKTGGKVAFHWRLYSLRPLVAAAGLPRALTPHRLRHACAVHLLQSGADIAHIARLLGHESLETTTIYLALTTKDMRRALDASHPRELEREVSASEKRDPAPSDSASPRPFRPLTYGVKTRIVT